MTGIAINQLIKLILGILAAAVVIAGVYVFFKSYLVGFFGGITGKGGANAVALAISG